MNSIKDNKAYKEALEFLEEGLKTNKNPKPVGQHSIDVANRLVKYNLGKDVVIAGLLHDLVEDTDVTLNQISSRFGEKVANLVDALTYDVPGYDYIDKFDRFVKSLEKVMALGSEALVIVASDFIENSPYYHLSNSPGLRTYLKEKYEYFMHKSKQFLQDKPVWNDLMDAYEKYVIKL